MYNFYTLNAILVLHGIMDVYIICTYKDKNQPV